MQLAVLVHDELVHVHLLAVRIGDDQVVFAGEGGGGGLSRSYFRGPSATGLEAVHPAADLALAGDIAVGFDLACDRAAVEAQVGAGKAAVGVYRALEGGHAGVVPGAVEFPILVHDELVHVHLLAVCIGDDQIILTGEGGGGSARSSHRCRGRGSGGSGSSGRGRGFRGGSRGGRGGHSRLRFLCGFRRRVGLLGHDNGHHRGDHQEQRQDQRDELHIFAQAGLPAGQESQHHGAQGQNAQQNLSHQQGRLPPGGDPLDGGAAGDAVHGVGVHHGVQDAVGGLPHAPGHVGVAGAALVKVLRLHHAVHQVGAGGEHGGEIHVGGGGAVPHVGDHDAGHAALIAEELRHHAALHAAPVVAHAVEGQHDAGGALQGLAVVLGARDGDGQLEGPHVDLADGLLIGPDADAPAQVLLVVQAHVLVVDVEAVVLHSRALISADHAGEVAVLGVVLEVPAGVGGALDVAAGAVEAVVAGPQCILADEVAYRVHQVRVEGGRQDAAGGVAHGLGILVGIVGQGGQAPGSGFVGLGEARGAVVVQGLHLVDGGDLPGAAHAGGDQVRDLVPGQLVQQGVPHGIVIGDLVAVRIHPELDQAEGAAILVGDFAEGGILAVVGGKLGLALLAVHVLIVPELLAPVQHHVVVPVLRGGALPVGAAHIRHGVVAPVLILVPVGVLELVGDLVARGLGSGESLLVQTQGDPIGHQGSCALGVHPAVGAGGRETLLRQDVVHGVVGVPGGGEVVVAVHDDVGLRVLAVVGRELALLHGDGHGLALAGGQELRLGEAHQLHAGSLHAVLPVVVTIGLLEVDLHDLLARGGTAVGDLHAHIVHGVRAGAGLLHAVVGIAEGGVALTVAEGIADGGVVVEAAGVGGAHDIVFIPGLGVAVAQVDTLLVDHVVAVLLEGAVVVHGGGGAFIGLGAEVGQGGVLAVIRPEGGGEAAGGVHLAGQDVADRVHAHLAGGADPQGRVHAVLLVVQEGCLHLVGEVQDHHDLLDGAGFLLGLQAPEEVLLHGAQLQIVAVRGVALAAGGVVQPADGILAPGHVAALAAQAGDEHDGGIAVLDEGGAVGLFHCVPRRVADGLGAGDAPAGGAGGAAVAGLLLRSIPVPQGLIHAEVAVALEGGLPAGGGGHLDAAAAGAAVHRIHGGDGEEAQAAAHVQGQGAVLILQEHHALGHGLLGGVTTRSHQAVQARVGGLVILGVLLAHVLGDLPEGGSLQEAGDRRRVLTRYDGAHHQDAEEDGQHRHRGLQAFGLDRHAHGGRDGVHRQAGCQQAHDDEEGGLPGGVDAHEGRADVGIEGVYAQAEGGQARQRHDVRAEAGLPGDEDQDGVCHGAGPEDPHGRPGHAVHAAGREAVEGSIGRRSQDGQDQSDDGQGVFLVFHSCSLLRMSWFEGLPPSCTPIVERKNRGFNR